MDIRKVRKLIELLQETGVGEIEIHEGDDSVRISLHSQNITPQAITMAPPMAMPAAPMQAQSLPSDLAPAAPAAPSPKGHELKAPMVGTVYLSPKPGADPFVKIGDKVKVGDTICIIEAMKMYNKIEADKAGVISARLVNNEQPVEFDQTLFVIEDE